VRWGIDKEQREGGEEERWETYREKTMEEGRGAQVTGEGRLGTDRQRTMEGKG